MKRIFSILFIFAAMSSAQNYTGAYSFDTGVWAPITTTSSANPLPGGSSEPPPAALTCYSTTLRTWIAWTAASCGGGGGGGGTVTGSGTTGFIPKWTSSSALGNSAMDDSISRADAVSLTNKVFDVEITSTNPGILTNQSWYSEINWNPSGALTGSGEFVTNMWVEQNVNFDASSGTAEQSNGYFETISTGNTAPIDVITGLYSEIQTNGAATVTNTYGFASFNGNYGGTVNNLAGADLEGWSEHGTVQNATGSGASYSQAGNGTTVSARAVEGLIHVEGTGVITTGYTFRANAPQVRDSGTIGTLYGVEIDEQAHAGISTVYQLYSAGVSPTYFHSSTFQLDNITGHGTAGIVLASNTGVLSQSLTLPNGALATTQSANDNSTKVATTAYVDGRSNYTNLCAQVTLTNATCSNGLITGGTTPASITISAIPGTFLNLDLDVIGSTSTSGVNVIKVTVNSDTTSGHYIWQRSGALTAGTSTLAGSVNAAISTNWSFALLGGTNEPAGSIKLRLPFYAQTSQRHTANGVNWFGDAAGGGGGGEISGEWTQTSAITSVSFAPTTGTFATGVLITIYGTN